MNVYQVYGGELRIGQVIDKRVDESGWAHYKIKWAHDQKYEKTILHKEKMRAVEEGTFYRQWYRSDRVTPFDITVLQEKLNFFLDNSGKTR